MKQPSLLSKLLLKTVSAVEAFRTPKAEERAFSFNTWQSFVRWFSDQSSDNDAKESVTAESGTKISTVWSCLNVLAQDIASLELYLYKYTENGREFVRDGIWRLISKKPNRYENAWQFWYGMVFVGEAWGNSYAYIVRNGRGEPIELLRLRPWEMSLQIIEGDLFYIYCGKPIPPRDIFHYRSFVLDSPEGISKIVYNANLMGLKQKQNRYAARSTGNRPPGFLAFNNATEKQVMDSKKSWNDAVNGDEIGGTPVLWGDIDYKNLMLSPEASEIVQMTEWSDVNTYAIWRMQPTMVSQHKNSNYSNAEQQNISYSTFTLHPIIANFEQEMCEKLFSEANKASLNPTEPRFDMNTLKRGDMQAVAAYVHTMRVDGLMSADEIREEFLDLPPQKLNGEIGIGKKYLIQGAMIPVDLAGNNQSTQTKEIKKVNGHEAGLHLQN